MTQGLLRTRFSQRQSGVPALRTCNQAVLCADQIEVVHNKRTCQQRKDKCDHEHIARLVTFVSSSRFHAKSSNSQKSFTSGEASPMSNRMREQSVQLRKNSVRTFTGRSRSNPAFKW